MHVSVFITLDADDTFSHSPNDAAGLVLAALEGDPVSDVCYATIQQGATGQAGTDPSLAQAADG